jgi:ParB family chromosome partitioning protein
VKQKRLAKSAPIPCIVRDTASEILAEDDSLAENMQADLPIGDDAALWEYLTVLDQGSRLALLAHCLSFGINALHEKVNPYGAGISASGLTRRMAHADLVARAVDLDMVEAGWEPTVDGYLRVLRSMA